MKREEGPFFEDESEIPDILSPVSVLDGLDDLNDSFKQENDPQSPDRDVKNPRDNKAELTFLSGVDIASDNDLRDDYKSKERITLSKNYQKRDNVSDEISRTPSKIDDNSLAIIKQLNDSEVSHKPSCMESMHVQLVCMVGLV